MSASALLVAALVASQIQTHPTGLKTVGLSHGRRGVRTVQILDKLYEQAGKPSLDFDFARYSDLHDNATGETSLVTFSRSAASSPGTYVGSDGLIKTAAVNELLYSEQFNQWTNSNTTDLANQVDAPDGKQTADEIEATAANGTIVRGVTTTAIDYTFSVYLKRKTGTGNIDISVDGSTWVTQSVTGDWQRFSVTQTGVAGTSNAGIRIVTSGDEVYAWGAQLEEGTVATPYIRTTSQALAAPRFDHDPVTGESLGLLVEEARSNLFLNSATLATQTVTTTAAAHTLSFYGTGTVDLTGTHTATVVGTGAYPARTTLTFTPTAGSLTATVTGTVQFAQLETGAFPTSYIPTAGTSLSRAADVAAVQDEDFSTTNLISYSESFDVGWIRANMKAFGFGSVANAIVSPDGQATADLIVEDAATAGRSFYQTVSATGTLTWSLFVKSYSGNRFVRFQTHASSSWFDLENGVWGTIASGMTANVEAYPNGWYRISLTGNPTAPRYHAVGISDADNIGSYTGDGTSGIYLWGASLTATEYPVAYTTTRNLLEDSQDFERSTWSLASATIGNDVAQAPDGTITADDATATGANATVRNATTTLAVSYTFSVWLKRKTGTGDVDISVDGTTWVTQSVTSAWQRFTVTQTGVAGTSNTGVRIVDSGDAVYIWGAQLEPGTVATDYVRTVDTVGKAYRWYEPTEGTVFVEAQNPASGTRGIVGIDDNTANERIEAQTDGTDPEWLVIDGGSGTTIDAGSVTAYTFFSLAGAYKHDDLAASVNGGAAVTGTDTVPSVNLMRIGALQASGTYLNGHIKRLTYWPVRQPDATLQVITQ